MKGSSKYRCQVHYPWKEEDCFTQNMSSFLCLLYYHLIGFLVHSPFPIFSHSYKIISFGFTYVSI